MVICHVAGFGPCNVNFGACVHSCYLPAAHSELTFMRDQLSLEIFMSLSVAGARARGVRGGLPYGWGAVSNAGGFDQLVSSCPMRQFLKRKSSLLQHLKAEIRSHYFMDIFRLRSCSMHGSCVPAGERQAEHPRTILGCLCVASSHLLPPHSFPDPGVRICAWG